MKKTKLLALLAATTMTAMSLVGCNGGSTNSDTIKIGGSFALTGEVAQYGIAASNGAQLAIEEYNAAGGVLEKQIEFILEDNKGNQVEAANTFRKLVDNNKVVAFLGSDVSSTTETIANIAKETGTPMITPTGTKGVITSIAPNVFRACYIDPTQGELLAQFSADDLQAKTAAIMVNSESDYSTGIAESFEKSFTAAGGSVALTVNYSKSDIDFKPILANVKNANVDVIVVPDYYQTIALITAQAKEIGIDATFIGGDGWDGVTTQTANNPEVVEGSYFINHYSPQDENPLIQNFLTSYKAKYNEEPNAFAALGYDAARIMIEAIKSADSTDAAAITEALKNTSLECVTGNVSFDENRNPVKSVAVIQIKDGQNTLYKKLDPK
ncbi:MAG: ABC transporter substrate-binding protein [Cellulosilyticaceae bacterium]